MERARSTKEGRERSQRRSRPSGKDRPGPERRFVLENEAENNTEIEDEAQNEAQNEARNEAEKVEEAGEKRCFVPQSLTRAPISER